MAPLSLADLRARDDAELHSLVMDERQRLFRLKVQQAAGHTKLRTHEIREARKSVARALTLIREREIAAANNPA